MVTDLVSLAGRFNIGKVRNVTRFGSGLVNDTYLVRTGGSKYILQKLHPIFKPSLLEDTEAVTGFLDRNGQPTPILVKTETGRLGVIRNKDCWRMLTYIPGRCYETGISPSQAFQAAGLLGKFHDTLTGFRYDFKHTLSGFHDPDRRINRLKEVLIARRNTKKYGLLYPLAEKVIVGYDAINIGRMKALPDRIIHGDLKISNIRFDRNGRKAVGLLDLDTICRHKIVTDICGAARTWCNPAGEDDMDKTGFDLKVFDKMMEGYAGTAKFITEEELRAVPEYFPAVLLGLTSRFIVDAFEESYFKLTGKYADLYEQNRTKALAQLKLYEDYRNKKEKVIRSINKLCRQ